MELLYTYVFLNIDVYNYYRYNNNYVQLYPNYKSLTDYGRLRRSFLNIWYNE